MAKVNPLGTGLAYCGYIGGNNVDGDFGVDIAVDSSGSAYVSGYTSSNQTSFPETVGPDLTHNGGIFDAFVAKVNPLGTGLIYCGYIGGSSDNDIGLGVAVDSSGSAYVAGYTVSTEATFPVTLGPDLTHNGGGADAFVAKVDPAGTGLVYCGYIGGNNSDQGTSIALDSSGNAYISGLTLSTEATFPVTAGPDDTYNGGFFDAFVAKLDAAGTGLLYCGYIGGSDGDQGFAIAVDDSGSAYITGFTQSSEATFPATVGPDLSYNGGARDAFVAKVRESAADLSVTKTDAPDPVVEGNPLVYTVTVFNGGPAAATGVTLTDALPPQVAFVTAASTDPTDTCMEIGGAVTCNLGTMAPGEQTVITITVQVLSGAGTTIINIANVAAIEPDTNLENNTATATTTVLAPPPPPAPGKVTGGGSVSVTDGKATFSFNVKRDQFDGPVTGHLLYHHEVTGDHVHSLTLTSLVISGNTATFTGTGRNQLTGMPVTFTVTVVDNGEPGSNDRFTIGGTGFAPAGGALRSGNIQIHKPKS